MKEELRRIILQSYADWLNADMEESGSLFGDAVVEIASAIDCEEDRGYELVLESIGLVDNPSEDQYRLVLDAIEEAVEDVLLNDADGVAPVYDIAIGDRGAIMSGPHFEVRI